MLEGVVDLAPGPKKVLSEVCLERAGLDADGLFAGGSSVHVVNRWLSRARMLSHRSLTSLPLAGV